MSNFFEGNRFLTTDEMRVNAKYIYAYLGSRGWTLNAVAGMLGNMETESTINPSIWQNLTEDESNGYGLVQWTPATKFLNWCDDNGLDPSHMNSALKRIEYELENDIQWIATDAYPYSFAEFKTSTRTPAELAQWFLRNYERPAEQEQPARSTQAEAWYTYLEGEDVDPSPSPIPTKNKKMPLWLMFTATRRKV